MTIEELSKFLDQTQQLNDEALKKALLLFDKHTIELSNSLNSVSPLSACNLSLIFQELRELNRNMVKLEFKLNDLINLQTICNSQLVNNTNTLIDNSNKEKSNK